MSESCPPLGMSLGIDVSGLEERISSVVVEMCALAFSLILLGWLAGYMCARVPLPRNVYPCLFLTVYVNHVHV